MTTSGLNLNRLLVINPFGIGDVLFTTPLIKNIRRNFPNIYLAYLCNVRTAEILKANPHIDIVYIFEKDYYRDLAKKTKLKCLREFMIFLNSIKKEKFDSVVDLSLGRHYSFFCWLIGIKKRIGFNYKNRGSLLTDKININGYDNKHVIEYYLELLKYLKVDYEDEYLDLFLPQNARVWSEKFLQEEGVNKNDTLIAIVPGGGASWGRDASIKHWSTEGFAKVANRLIDEYKVKILVMGDSKDQASCLEVVNEMKSEAIQCCGRTDIMQFASLLARCKLVITNDGGPLHLAVAARAKTVSIFGPVDDRVYGPYPRTNDHKVIKKYFDCQPCYHRFKLPTCDKDRACLKEVTAEEVYEAAKELLLS